MFTFLKWLALKRVHSYYVLHSVITLLNETINFIQNSYHWTVCLSATVACATLFRNGINLLNY